MGQTLNKHRDGLILLVFPLILAFINSNWIFTPATNYMPDPWFYLAYFRNFFEYAPAFPSNSHYWVERLTWNVPGYVLYEIFPALLANYILHLAVYYVAVFSLYGTIKLLFNRRTALLSALLMGGYPWFLRAVGWDYTDGVGIAHMLLLLYLLTLAHYSGRLRLWLLLAGAVHTSLLITNLFWLFYAPGWILYFFILNFHTRKFQASQFFLSAAYFLLGSIVPILLGGLFYYQVTGNYFFLLNSIRIAVHLSSDEINAQNLVLIYGHHRPYWHILPVIIIAISTWRIFSSSQYRVNFAYLAAYVLSLLAYGWLVFWHYFSIPLLIVFPYSSFVIPAVFLLFAATLSTDLDELQGKDFTLVTALTFILLCLPMVLVLFFPTIEMVPGNILPIAFLGMSFVLLLSIPRLRPWILPAVCMVVLLYFFVGEKSYVYISDRWKGRDTFLAVIAASEAIDFYYPDRNYRDVHLWFRADEKYDTFFSLACLYLYPWGSALGDPYSGSQPPTQLTLVESDSLEDGDNIVILSSNPRSTELLSEANRSALDQNVKLSLVMTETIHQGASRFFLYFTKVNSLQ